MPPTALTDPVSSELPTLLRTLKLGKLLDIPKRITLSNEQHLPR
jgi:hypothetical protein